MGDLFVRSCASVLRVCLFSVISDLCMSGANVFMYLLCDSMLMYWCITVLVCDCCISCLVFIVSSVVVSYSMLSVFL